MSDVYSSEPVFWAFAALRALLKPLEKKNTNAKANV